MRIRLDAHEIGSIIVAWAKKQYRTHNISVTFDTATHADIEVTLGEDQIAGSNPELQEEFINRLRGINNEVAPEPDNTPDFSIGGEPI